MHTGPHAVLSYVQQAKKTLEEEACSPPLHRAGSSPQNVLTAQALTDLLTALVFPSFNHRPQMASLEPAPAELLSYHFSANLFL